MSTPHDSVLRRVQALSGLVFGTFLIAHLANTLLAIVSAELYDSVQAWLRFAYQAWFVEAVILAALVAHLAVAVARKRGGRPAPLSVRGRWHRNAGIFLAVVIGGHIGAVRGASWFADVHPGFAGLSFTLAHVPGYFYPYYFLFGTAALFHGLNGFRVAAARLGWEQPFGTVALVAATAAGSVLMFAALLGFGGLLYSIGDPYDNDFARLVLQALGSATP